VALSRYFSTNTVSAYKRCRCYAPWLALGLLFLQTGSMLTHLIGIATTTDLWHTQLTSTSTGFYQ